MSVVDVVVSVVGVCSRVCSRSKSVSVGPGLHSDRYTISCIYGDSTKGFKDSASPVKPQFLWAVLQPLGSFKVVLICYLLLTYWLTYFVTYLIRRTRRRAISDVNKDNELLLRYKARVLVPS